MRRIVVTLMVAMAVLAMVAGPVLAQAQTFTKSVEIPIRQIHPSYDPCTGGYVFRFTGTIHSLVHETITPNGDIVFVVDNNYQDVRASTGTGTYRLVGATPSEVNVGPSGATEFTAEDTVNLVSEGQAAQLPNEQVHILTHYTIDANGDVTATVDNISIECRG